MKKARFNLVLILWAPHAKTETDLTEIADRVMQINPSIRAFVVRHHKIDQLRLCHTWPEPTLTVSFFTITEAKADFRTLPHGPCAPQTRRIRTA